MKWVDHLLMVINMNESKLCTIIQIEAFLAASSLVEFSEFGEGVLDFVFINFARLD